MKSQQLLQKRKLLLAMPLLVLPFLTMAFWALDGGKANTKQKSSHSGLDLTLPAPKVKNNLSDKLSLYELAEKKSERLKEAKASDPYNHTRDTNGLINKTEGHSAGFSSEEYSLQTNTNFDKAVEESRRTEIKLRKQLAELKARINQPPKWEQDTDDYLQEGWPATTGTTPAWQSPPANLQVAPLPTGPDPELQQLDNMLTKILDIEHPQRVRARLQQRSLEKRGRVFPVRTKQSVLKAALLRPKNNAKPAPSGNVFYDSQTSIPIQDETAIPAVVHETQTLVSGATIKLRLTDAVYINGQEIPPGTFVFGVCTLEGDRLKVSIQNIRFKNTILPVNLSVYDLDAIKGIRIPGAISRDAVKTGMQNGIRSLDFYNMNPSLGAQAASAGIQTFKSLLGHKAKLIKATVRAGYPVLLVDNNKHNQ